MQVARYQKVTAPSQKAKVFLMIQKLRVKYLDTPGEKVFQEFIAKLAQEVCQPVENFNDYSTKYSKKYGKQFTKDPRYVREGERALSWKSGKKYNTAMKIQPVPKDSIAV